VSGRSVQRAPVLWSAGGFLAGLGVVLMSLRARVSDEVSYVIGQPLMLLGILLAIMSLRADLRGRAVWVGLVAVGFVYALLLWWLLPAATHQTLGMVIRAVNMTAMLTLALTAWQVALSEASRSARVIALAFGLQAVGIGVNLVNASLGSSDIHTLAGGSAIVLTSLVFLVCSIAASVGFFGLFLERATRREVQEAEALARWQQWRDRNSLIVQLELERILSVLSRSLGPEIRQPLTAATLHVQHGQRMLLQGSEAAEPLLAVVERVIHNIRRTDDTTRRMRHLLTPPRHDAEAVACDGLLHDVSRLVLTEAISRGVTVRFPPPGRTAWVKGDPLHLKHALLQVVRNAQWAVRGREPAEVHVSLVVTALQVRVHVADTGPGLPPAVLERYNRAQGGWPALEHGIGLFVVQSILEQHDGWLLLDNSPAGGAVVTLVLPRYAPADATQPD
jgi:signal transduction histidine kinase